MIKKTLFCILISSALSFSCYAVQAISSNKIVAIVNGDVITQNELDKREDLLKKQTNANELINIRKKALDSLIDELLQLQVAQRNKLQVSEKDIDRAISIIAKSNKITMEQLKNDIQEHTGLTFKQYRQQIHDQMLINQIRAPLTREISISNSEIETFLHNPPKLNNTIQKQYHIIDIVIETPDTTSLNKIEDSKNIANKISVELRKNEIEPEKIVQNNKTTDQQITINDLGWRKINDLPSLFTKTVIEMKTKQVSDPIQAPNGFHVVKLLETNDQINISKEQAREIIYHQKLEKLLKPWLKDLRNASYIKIIVNNK